MQKFLGYRPKSKKVQLANALLQGIADHHRSQMQGLPVSALGKAGTFINPVENKLLKQEKAKIKGLK